MTVPSLLFRVPRCRIIERPEYGFLVAENEMGLSTMKSNKDRVVRFRRWSSVVFACVVSAFFGVLFVGLGGAAANSGVIYADGVVALILLLPFVSVLIWFIFKLCIFSGVNVSADRVTVRNFSTETEIDVNMIDSVKWKGGVCLLLKNRTKVKSIAFPDSLFSFILQYSNFRRVAKNMDAEIKRRSHGLSAVDSAEIRQIKQWDLSLLVTVGLSYFSLLVFSYIIFS